LSKKNNEMKDKIKNNLKNQKDKAKNTTQKNNTKKESKYTITTKKKKDTNDKLRRNFYISSQVDNYLNRISKKTNRSKSELVEKAIKIMQQEVEIK